MATPHKIAITTSSFADGTKEHLELIASKGLGLCRNTAGRTLKSEELVSLTGECVGIIAGTEQYDSSTLGRLKNLKVISRCGAGMDNIDMSAAEKLGIRIFNTPNAPTRAVAELVIGLALDLLRHVSLMDRELRQGTWNKRMGRLFQGKHFGLIGFGRIGREVGKLAVLLGARVSYFDPIAHDVHIEGIELSTLTQLLETCDIISVHTPLTPKTSNMLDANALGLMKRGSLLINCARAGIVDEEALLKALEHKIIAGAALDVFGQEPYRGPLTKLDNVILTPHIGSYAQEARISMEIEAVENLIKGLNQCKVI